MKDKKELGRNGERLAAEFLINQGFEILERNFRHKRGEIDIIGLKDGLLIFIEVKYRSGLQFGHPEEMVSDNQMETIAEAAEEYTYINEWNGDIRFDIISISDQRGEISIDHFVDVY